MLLGFAMGSRLWGQRTGLGRGALGAFAEEGVVRCGGGGGEEAAGPHAESGDDDDSAGKKRAPVAIWRMSAAAPAKRRVPAARKKLCARRCAASLFAEPCVLQKLATPSTRWKIVAAVPTR
jgi:hypothetical protein